jgi:hypothetical protein
VLPKFFFDLLAQFKLLVAGVQSMALDLSKFQADFAAFQTAFGNFATDFATYQSNVQNALVTLTNEAGLDSTNQAVVDNLDAQTSTISAKVAEMDTAIQAASFPGTVLTPAPVTGGQASAMKTSMGKKFGS